MKQKTLIILGSAYLVLVAVILLVAFLNKGGQLSTDLSSSEVDGDEISSLNLDGTSQSSNIDSESQNSYPDQHINESNTRESEKANGSNEELTETLASTGGFFSNNTNTAVSTNAVSIYPTYTPSRSSSAYPINTPTRTPIPTNSTSSTPSPTITPTPQTGWAGEWTVYFQQSDGTYISGDFTFTISGTDLLGSGMINDTDYSFEGRIISGGQSAFGTWTSAFDSGSFDWILISDNQFAGSRDSDFGLCGARPGLNPPEPCYNPPLS